jgi:hypothetical protein
MSSVTKGKNKGNDESASTEGKQVPQTPTALAVVAPSIMDLTAGSLSSVSDEITQAFGTAVVGQERNEAPGITIVRIDHKNERFLVSGEPQETVRGYVVHWFQARAWWKQGYKSSENNPPDCSSPDMITPKPGDNRQAKTCFDCPMSQFGSGRDGSGQACKVTTFLFLLNPEFGNPPVAALLAPPSSIRNVVGTARNPGYLGRAKQVKNAKTGKPAGFYELVYTEFSLERGGDLHCVITPEPLVVAPSVDEARAIAAVRGQLLKQMNDLREKVGDFTDVTEGA